VQSRLKIWFRETVVVDSDIQYQVRNLG